MRKNFLMPVKKTQKRKGYVALSSLLVISAVVLMVVISASLLSLSEGQMGDSVRKGEEAFFFVEGCLEEALLRARDSSVYEGGVLNLPDGQCTIDIIKDDGNWTVTASGSKDGYQRSVEAQIRRGCDQIELISWQEVE